MGRQLRRDEHLFDQLAHRMHRRTVSRPDGAANRQIVVHLAGGIAEAISRGERRKHAVLRFAKLSCNADADLKLAAAVLADLRKLTGRRLRAYTNKSE
jgi:hypothetical protein